MKIFKARPDVFKVVLLLLALPLAGHAITTETGKSFFSPQSLSTIVAPLGDQRYQFAGEEPSDALSLSVTPFYFKSTNPQTMRRLFFPDRKDSLAIKGSEADGSAPDVSGTWLQIAGYDDSVIPNNPSGVAAGNAPVPFERALEMIYNRYSSNFMMNPEYTFAGVNLRAIKKFIVGNNEIFVTCGLPVVSNIVKHNMAESNVQNSLARIDVTKLTLAPADAALVAAVIGNDVRFRYEPINAEYSTSATEAFGNPNRQYGKLSNAPLLRQGFGDLDVKIGIAAQRWSIFAKATAPLAEKPTNEFMFEPLLGNGGNWAVGAGAGVNLGQELHAFAWDLGILAEYEYFFGATQLRTYDLASNGNWSRYLMMNKYQDQQVQVPAPGVNFLTLKTNVNPTHGIKFSANSLLRKAGFFCGKVDLNYALQY